jgi:hypothetical protein
MAPDRKPKSTSDDLVDWFTVSYRTIYIAIGVVLLVGGGVGYHYYSKNVVPNPPTTESASPAVTTARFTTLEGNVKVKPVGQFEWMNADGAMVLRKSDLIRTGPGGAAEITFFDGTVVHVRPDSLITIEETSEDPNTKRRRVAWHISSGEVNFKAPRPTGAGAERQISTPTVRTTTQEAAVGGVTVEESGESSIKAYTGTLQVYPKTGEALQIGPNTQVKVDAVGRAGAPQNLPPVPVLLAPPHQAEIAKPDTARATTLLAWRPVPAAAGYHFQIDYSPYFNRPIYDRRDWKEPSIELRGLDVGKYYWRVAAIDDKGAEGSFSEFARFTVSRPAGGGPGTGPPPPLAIDGLEVRQNILQVRGRTEPGATVTVNDQRVDVAADGSFNEFITLTVDKPGRQMVVIKSTGINGGENTQRRPVAVGE